MLLKNINNNSVKFNSLFLCAASTVKRPITDTAQNIHLKNKNQYYNNTTTTTTTITNTSTINNNYKDNRI
jgi:hypothetical protein